MSEASTRTEGSAKSRAAKESATSIGFQFPGFEMPKLEMPDGFREIAAQWVNQGKANFERALTTAEEVNSACASACTTATKCVADYTTKLTEMTHKNAAANFDLVHDLMTAKSLPEAMDVSMVDARKQFEALTAQSQELWSLAQKLAVESAKPLTANLPKAFQAPASS
jgi:phasin